MKKNVLLKFFVGVMIMFPFIGQAAEVTTQSVCDAGKNMDSLSSIINWASCLLMSTIVPFLFALATAAFIWGVISYYLNPDNEEKRKKGKSFLIGGLVALFVMTSMWGIIRIFSTTFETGTVIPSFDNIKSSN
jgi:hypothetical protein